MLKAYFDDSGTHNGSDVILMGGLIAHEDEWTILEGEWKAALAEFGLRKMHMSQCENRKGDFEVWERPERDRIVERFRRIIEARSIMMLSSAVTSAAWMDAVARSQIADIFDEPISYCFNFCMRKAMSSYRASKGNVESVAVVFDSRQQNIPVWQKLATGYEKFYPSKLAGAVFSRMEEVLPLQAADMIAYEVFRFTCDYEKTGDATIRRPNFARLVESLAYSGGTSTADHLVEYAELVRPARKA